MGTFVWVLVGSSVTGLSVGSSVSDGSGVADTLMVMVAVEVNVDVALADGSGWSVDVWMISC